jgi:hypothetical protein
MSNAAYDRWCKAAETFRPRTIVYTRDGSSGHLGGCARCGGGCVVTEYLAPFSGSAALHIKGDPSCETCRIDRVKRWGDLMEACPAARAERLSTWPWGYMAPILQRHGMIVHVSDEGAWELTDAGRDALARFDAGRRSK